MIFLKNHGLVPSFFDLYSSGAAFILVFRGPDPFLTLSACPPFETSAIFRDVFTPKSTQGLERYIFVSFPAVESVSGVRRSSRNWGKRSRLWKRSAYANALRID
jgi:hypothetical protein